MPSLVHGIVADLMSGYSGERLTERAHAAGVTDVLLQPLGGGFGRHLEFDGTLRAVQIAQQVQGPVQVIWTREEDIQHDMYRPYYYDRLSAGVNAQGKAVAWPHRVAGSSIIARYSPATVVTASAPCLRRRKLALTALEEAKARERYT